MQPDPTVEQFLNQLFEKKRQIGNQAVVNGPSKGATAGDLKNPDGARTSGLMEDRVARLETHFEYLRRDLDSIDSKLDLVIERTSNLPTKGDLTTFRWQWVATAVAAIALIVGGIIGGLSWIKPDAEPAKATPPTIVQVSPASPGTVAKP